jgi:superfamily II DNA/RNA helicase
MAKVILNNPEEISLSVSKPADNILQAAYFVEDNHKLALLTSLVEGKSNIQSALVFASTKVAVRDIEKKLIKDKASARAIHSDLDQRGREEVLRDFKNRKFQILVATDIISRGIDIEDIDLVVNYDVPHDPEDYVHRIGRTARAQSDGVALTFINRKQRRSFDMIEKFLGTKIYKIPVPEDL